MNSRWAAILAATMSLSAPMSAGVPALDTGHRRTAQIGPRVLVPRAPSQYDNEALARAEAKRARQAARRGMR